MAAAAQPSVASPTDRPTPRMINRSDTRSGNSFQKPPSGAPRLASTAIDRIGQARDAVADEIAAYAGSDVVCYLAEHPTPLVERQAREWGPWRDWAAREMGVVLEPVEGIVHRQEMPKHDLVESLVHKQHVQELTHKLDSLHSADVAHILEALPLEDRLFVWDLVKAERTARSSSKSPTRCGNPSSSRWTRPPYGPPPNSSTPTNWPTSRPTCPRR